MSKRLQKQMQQTKGSQTLADLKASKQPVGKADKVTQVFAGVKCNWARMQVPLRWAGSEHNCGKDMMVKGLAVDNDRAEIKETCDGGLLNVQENYWLEVLVKGKEQKPEGWDAPLQWEIDAAASNGFILYDLESDEFSNPTGDKTLKYRFWVRPDTRVPAYRDNVCKG